MAALRMHTATALIRLAEKLLQADQLIDACMTKADALPGQLLGCLHPENGFGF